VGRNPQTGKEIEISARRVLTFRPSQVLKSALNGEAPPENHAEIDAREEEADDNDEFESDDQDFADEADGK
jgi:integration host factor subunit alpha